MRNKGRLAALFGLALGVLGGCTSEDTQRLMREAALPPVAVTRAARNGPYWQNVSIQEVVGAPEFRWFDGGAILTTRPTRVQATKVFVDDLDKVGMLASSRINSEYMLYVKFEDLHGPDMLLFTDKHATAAITFRLVRWRTGQVIKSKRIVAEYSANLGGITPETGRMVAFGAVGEAAFGLIGLTSFQPAALANDDHLLPSPIWDRAGNEDLLFQYQLLQTSGTPMSEIAQVGPANGTLRRIAAWHGLVNLAFDHFMNELSHDGSVVYKRAISCDALGGYAEPGFNARRAQAQWIETDETYAVDCPSSNFMASLAHQAYPRSF